MVPLEIVPFASAGVGGARVSGSTMAGPGVGNGGAGVSLTRDGVKQGRPQSGAGEVLDLDLEDLPAFSRTIVGKGMRGRGWWVG